MINCNEFLQHLSDYVEGNSTRDTKRKMDEHAASCPSCAKVKDNFILTLNSVKRLPKVNASSDFEDQLRQRILEDKIHPITESRGRSREFSLKPFVASVATAAAIGLVALLINIKFLSEPEQPFYSPRLTEVPMPKLENAVSPQQVPVYQAYPGNPTTIGGTQVTYPDTSLFRYNPDIRRRRSSEPLWKIQADTQSTSFKRDQ
ncbi:zf-HC2 domain-containing protein [candidate division KSB1 bacterium]